MLRTTLRLAAVAVLGATLTAVTPTPTYAAVPPTEQQLATAAVAVHHAAQVAVRTVRVVAGHTSWGLAASYCGSGALHTSGVSVRSPQGTRRAPAAIWPGDTATITCATTGTPTAPTPRVSAPRSGWVSPLASYRITTCYEWRRALYVNGKLVSKAGLHEGLDMSTGYGSRVGAVAAGTVIRVGWRGGYGRAVEISHGGGVTSMYAHLSSISVRYGQHVVAGQRIGGVGSTGASTGNHLHLGMYRNGADFNPTPWLEARGVPIYGC